MSTVTGVPGATPKYTKKDFESDQDVRWCPGCGDYAILSAVQKSMPDLGIPKEDIVFISASGATTCCTCCVATSTSPSCSSTTGSTA